MVLLAAGQLYGLYWLPVNTDVTDQRSKGVSVQDGTK